MLAIIKLISLGIKSHIQKYVKLSDKHITMLSFILTFIIIVWFNPLIFVETLAECKYESVVDLEIFKKKIENLDIEILKQELAELRADIEFESKKKTFFIGLLFIIGILGMFLIMDIHMNNDADYRSSLNNDFLDISSRIAILQTKIDDINTAQHLNDISEISRLLEELKFKHEVLSRADYNE